MNETLKPLLGIFTPEQLETARPSKQNDCPFCGKRCGSLFTFDCHCAPKLILCGECFDDFYDTASAVSMDNRLFRCPGCELNLYDYRVIQQKREVGPIKTDSVNKKPRKKVTPIMGNVYASTKDYLHPSRLTIDTEACRIGRYQTERFISKGAFGHVMLAHHIDDEFHQYAIKVIYKDRRVSHSQEIAILKDLKGVDGVLQYVEHFETDHGALVIVTEYEREYQELYDVLVKAPFTPYQANTVFKELCRIMAMVHKRGIVHRDLKPENILVNPITCKVVIVDWGLAFYPAKTNARKSCGSPNYAAPEVVSGKDYDGPEVDVWSMGVILYAMATASLPFEADYVPALFTQIRRCQVNYNNLLLTDAQVAVMRQIFVLNGRPTMAQLAEA